MANVETYNRVDSEITRRTAERQAYQLLHFAFVAAPVIAGLDKFTHLLTNWDAYIAPPFARMLRTSTHGFMLAVGVVEIVAGLLVAVRPKVGGLVVAAWLAVIIMNLLVSGHYFDIALRDFGLLLGALALSRIAQANEATPAPPRI